MEAVFQALADIDEIGIADTIRPEESVEFFKAAMQWVSKSSPQNPRTVWFPESTSLPKTKNLQDILKSRIVPMEPEAHQAWLQGMGPFPAVLTRGSAPNFLWCKLYAAFGKLMATPTPIQGWTLWTWRSVQPPRRALMVCHHNGVLPDIRRQLLIHGVKGDFYWLCDGKPAMGDAWPSTFGPLANSAPLRLLPIDTAKQVFDAALIADVAQKYDLIVTSHCMRYPVIFAAFNKPLLHINSTRFGGGTTPKVDEFADLQVRIKQLIEGGRLTVIHNNKTDQWYSGAYMGAAAAAPVIPSLCEQSLRFRIKAPKPNPTQKRFLIWDTRFHITDGKPGILRDIAESLADCADVNSVLIDKGGKFLGDDALAPYDAVIHIPYNISTMSFFEQGSANIPVWLPTPRLLAEILATEYSELSWYCFEGADARQRAERPDRVWEKGVIEDYVSRSDFTGEVFQNLLTFDSVQELRERVLATDYDAVVKKSYGHTVHRKVRAAEEYLRVLRAMGFGT